MQNVPECSRMHAGCYMQNVWECSRMFKNAYRSMSLHTGPWACMQLHKLACSFMTLYAVPFFVWAAHKNFAVLVYFKPLTFRIPDVISHNFICKFFSKSQKRYKVQDSSQLTIPPPCQNIVSPLRIPGDCGFFRPLTVHPRSRPSPH